MAFVSTIIGRTVFGNKRVVVGTYTNGAADTGGDIDTGLRSCEALLLQPTGAAVVASAPSVNETLPVCGNAVTIVNTADEDGIWIAIGV
jgi:hypothetical protein